MRKTISILLIIISISVGVIISSFASDEPKKTIQRKKTTATITPSPSVLHTAPTQTPSPYTEIVPEYNCTVIEHDVFTKINKARLDAGLHTLEWSDELYRAAKIRSSELVKNQSHTRPDGSSCFTVSNELSRENIAYGYPTSDDVYNAWMNSSGHKKNILAKDVKTVA